MTISNREQCVNVNELIDSVKILVICPICSESKKLEFPKSICESTDNLTTISIPKGLICNHPFQAFVDKNYKIRGYQKVDYEFKPVSQKPSVGHLKEKVKADEELFENLIAEGNYVEYLPKNTKSKKNQTKNSITESKPIGKPEDIVSSIKKTERQSKLLNHKEKKVSQEDPKPSERTEQKSKDKPLREIYEEFWEFIDDDNEVFQKYILLDDRRNKKVSDNLLSVLEI